MELRFGQNVAGLVVGGRELRAAVFNENEVRAAAGVTLLIAAVAFSYAYFEQQYLPLRIASAFLLVELCCARRSASATARPASSPAS